MGLRDDLLKIKKGEIAARDAEILALQKALSDEKQRVRRRDEEILRLQGKVKNREQAIHELQEEWQVKYDELWETGCEVIQGWEVKYAGLKEKLNHVLEHPAATEHASEAENGEDQDHISERSADLPSQREVVIPDEIESALPEELEVLHDSGYNSETAAGQMPELVHTRPTLPVDWSRLLMHAEQFPELHPDVVAIDYQDEDGPANIEGLSFEVLDPFNERLGGGSSPRVDRVCQTHIEGLHFEALRGFEVYCEETRHHSLELHRAHRAHITHVFGDQREESCRDTPTEDSMDDSCANVESGLSSGAINTEKTAVSGISFENKEPKPKPGRWAPKESTKLALDGSADDNFGHDIQVGNLFYDNNNANKPWNTTNSNFSAHISRKLKLSKRGNKGFPLNARVRERLVEEEETEDVMETLYRRLDTRYQVSVYPITLDSESYELSFHDPEADFLHNGLMHLGQQAQQQRAPAPQIPSRLPISPPQFPLACAPLRHPAFPIPSGPPLGLAKVPVQALPPPQPLASKMGRAPDLPAVLASWAKPSSMFRLQGLKKSELTSVPLKAHQPLPSPNQLVPKMGPSPGLSQVKASWAKPSTMFRLQGL